MSAFVHARVGGAGGGAHTEYFNSCPPPLRPPVTRFYTAVGLPIGERAPPPDGGIVQRCEAPAVKRSTGRFKCSCSENGGGGAFGVRTVGKRLDKGKWTTCF